MAVKSPGLCPLPLRMCCPKRGVQTTSVTGDNFRLCMVMVDFGFVSIVMCIRKKKKYLAYEISNFTATTVPGKLS